MQNQNFLLYLLFSRQSKKINTTLYSWRNNVIEVINTEFKKSKMTSLSSTRHFFNMAKKCEPLPIPIN